jgi:hypothetical protein
MGVFEAVVEDVVGVGFEVEEIPLISGEGVGVFLGVTVGIGVGFRVGEVVGAVV